MKIIKLKNKQKKSTISKFDKIEKEIQKIEIKLKSGEILLSNKFKDQKFLNQKFQAQSEKHSFSKEIDYLISLSASTGIPLLTTLKGVKKIIKQMKIVQSEIQTLLAMPKMTIKILRLLPLFTLAISFFLGINSVKFLFLSNLGYVCLLGGIIFYLFGELITKNFLDKFNSKLESKNILSDSRIQLQIIISGLKSGLNIFQLFQIVDLSKSFSSIKETRIKEAVNNGVSPVPYLKRQIQEINLKQKTEAKILTENLGTKLIIPLGLCYLPSFIFLGIMPIVISMITEI